MQRQFEAARRAVAGSPYEKYISDVLMVPERMALTLQHGPIDPATATPPTPEGLSDLISGRVKAADTGYCLIEGPTLYVQSRVDFPGSTPEMFEWWFWWHALDSRRYMIWFPYSHIDASVDDPVRLADVSLSYAARVYDNANHVVEYMGGDLFKSTIRFMDPTRLGIDSDAIRSGGFAASASGLLEVPGFPHITVGMMLHMVRPNETGMELLSRYYLGSHPALRRFPGSDQAHSLLQQGGMTPERMELVAFELSIHDMTEWNNLARLLPTLYAEFC